MCLAVPMQLVSISPQGIALGRHGTVEVEFSVELLDSPKLGEWALVHAGVAIERIDEDEARATIAMLKEVVDGPDTDPA